MPVFAKFFSMIFSVLLLAAGSCGHGTSFQLCHLMHITVVLLNFTRERVPSEDKEATSVFSIFF